MGPADSGSAEDTAFVATDPAAGGVRRPPLGCLVEVVQTLALTLVIFFVIQSFVAQPFEVKQNNPHAAHPSGYGNG